MTAIPTTVCPFKDSDWILFQGDSITDCGRREINDSSKLGNGYVSILRGFFAQRWPQLNIEFLNRAVSGDRVVDLQERWERDCLGLSCRFVSIMVGVNDVWRNRMQWQGQGPVPLNQFVTVYKTLLDRAQAAGVERFILMSPTTIDDDLESDLNKMLANYADAVKQLAADYKAIYVPAREAMRDAIKAAPQIKFTTDGCHPTIAGHGVIAAAWWKAVVGA